MIRGILPLLAFLFVPFAQNSALRFQVTTSLPAASGRLLIVIATSNRPEPRDLIGEAGAGAPVMLGQDVKNFGPGAVATIARNAAAFPISGLEALPAGDYFIQAVLHSNIDLNSPNAPGDAYSDVRRVHLDAGAGTIAFQLNRTVPAEQMPAEDQYVKYVKMQSSLLTRFYGRPIYLRAGIILPRNYERELAFPLRVHIGGYGTRYTLVQRLMSPNSEFRRMWLADDTPRFIYLQLDGDGPNGDSYQVNSDNNGPYGDAITQELIPYVEKTFRAVGQPYARVLDGESTGGWVSLALKIFYPDFFNAVWSSCPDGVDFHGFQLIDIYNDKNAYIDERGSDRPSKRDLNGNVEFTIRHECRMENVMGSGDSWTMSGQQWGAWNATYGPRGRDGRPVPLWDPKTGVIDKSVVDHWKKYDLHLTLEQNWKTLGPRLRGRIHISVGEADNYYLNNAVHILDDFLKKADPPAEARVSYGPGRGHCWNSLSERQMMQEMAVAVDRARAALFPLWEEQNSGTSVRLRGVSAVDPNVAWASGAKGTVARTVDGGAHWLSSMVPGASDLDFRGVHGVDADTAYVMSAGDGEKSRIYKTVDSGKSWTLQFSNSNPKAFLDAFAFWDANHGIALSDPVDGRFLILRTKDGGANWTINAPENSPEALPGEAAFAASDSCLRVFGTDGKLVWFATGGAAARVFRSIDGGSTWSVSDTPIISGMPSAGIFSIYPFNAVGIFVVGGDYQKEKEANANFAMSSDGGATWSAGPQLPGYRSAVDSVSGQDASVILAVGPSGVDYRRWSGGPWISTGLVGYDAVSLLPGYFSGWLVGQSGKIAKWVSFP
jgi:photosystem II stability/assembly factor-like uncharacterized protein